MGGGIVGGGDKYLVGETTQRLYNESFSQQYLIMTHIIIGDEWLGESLILFPVILVKTAPLTRSSLGLSGIGKYMLIEQLVVAHARTTCMVSFRAGRGIRYSIAPSNCLYVAFCPPL